MRLPQDANIDELVATAGGRDLAVLDGVITGELDLAAGAPVEVVVSYVSTGQDSWHYAPRGKDLRNFRLTATTNFSAIDYAFFWQGWTGLTVVIGAITTLFLIMQLTGRIDWSARFPDPAPGRPTAETA